MIELTSKLYEKQQKKGTKTNEGYIFINPRNKKKIIKVIEPREETYLKMKQHTIKLLLDNKEYLKELKIAIPEEEVTIDRISRGYQTTNIKGINLNYILNDPNVLLDKK